MADVTALVAELRALLARATPVSPLTVVRYEHGGGRVYLDGDAGKRVLVADFYNLADRECWIAAVNALPTLLDALEQMQQERDDERRAHVAIADALISAGCETDDGSSVGFARSAAARIAALEAAGRGTLASADAEWETSGAGHDWREACSAMRAALRGVEEK